MQDRRLGTPLTGSLTSPLNYPVVAASPDDAAAMAELHAEALPPGWPVEAFRSCFRPNRHVLKIGESPDLHAFGALQQAAGEAEILTLAVRREMRRRGLGFCLLAAFIDLCREKMCSASISMWPKGIRPRALSTKSQVSLLSRAENVIISRAGWNPKQH